MEAKELRPTNSVYRLIIDGKKVVDKRIVKFSTADYNYLAFFQPIEITEEILLKAGFENCGEGTYNHDYFNGIYFELDSDFIGNEDENICGDYDECVHIRLPNEFHKLQNIVYDLTGKELEINF